MKIRFMLISGVVLIEEVVSDQFVIGQSRVNANVWFIILLNRCLYELLSRQTSSIRMLCPSKSQQIRTKNIIRRLGTLFRRV